MPDKLSVEPQLDGRIFLLNNGLIVFIARTKEEIEAHVKVVFPYAVDPDMNKNDWTEQPGPFWR